jgi:Lamin Tail Domain
MVAERRRWGPPPVMVLLAVGCAPEYDDFRYCDWQDVVINEVASASVTDTVPGAMDFVEFYNGGTEPVDLAGWTISRSEAALEYTIVGAEDGDDDSATLVGPGQTLVVIAHPYSADDGQLYAGFDLNRDGDGVWLRTPQDDGYVLCDAALYPDQHAGTSWGRAPDGRPPDEDDEVWCRQAPTEGSANGPCLDADGGVP